VRLGSKLTTVNVDFAREPIRNADMARQRPAPGKCIHCLKDGVERNWDHVFPRSWYPDTTDPNLYKWQAPSCVPCNQAHGKIEEDLLVRFGLCLDPNHPASAGIVAKALRAGNPREAKNERDERARRAFGSRIIAETMQGAAIPKEATLPGMEDRWGTPLEEQVAVLVSKASIERMTEKVVRGIFYVEDDKYIEPPFTITTHVLHDADALPMIELIDRFGMTYSREPGIVVRRAVVPEDKTSSLFEIVFWQRAKIFAFVTDSRLDSGP
jgi:hypothetical protein